LTVFQQNRSHSVAFTRNTQQDMFRPKMSVVYFFWIPRRLEVRTQRIHGTRLVAATRIGNSPALIA